MMPGALLAPYNDSMRLGQGYNSFLHLPCILNAVKVKGDRVVRKPASEAGTVSQAVNYSSRFVEKISDVAKSMNASAGSSIRNGGIVGGGSAVTLDEAKFAASDLNVIVSVKVINQTTEVVDDAIFEPMEGVFFNSRKFFETYGNCYISGFIEGGDFTGIVCAKVLDISSKSEVERAIKSRVNSAGDQNVFTLNEGTGSAGSESALSKTETTITVGWSGGGQIKDENEEWTLDSLYRAAAGFPAKVAQCPQRTWAVLTPYNHTKNFVSWAEKLDIRVPQFDAAQVYANDLLDMYMEYKNYVNKIQAILANPLNFSVSGVTDPIGISIQELLSVRAEMKRQMKQINATVDKLALHPDMVDDIEASAKIQPPEVWSMRLPVPKAVQNGAGMWSPAQAADELAKFSFVSAAPPTGPSDSSSSSSAKPIQTPTTSASLNTALSDTMTSLQPPVLTESLLPPPCPHSVIPLLSPEETASLLSPFGRSKYSKSYLFTTPVGKAGGGFFNDAHELSSSATPVGCPRRIEANLVHWGHTESSMIIGWIKTSHEQMTLTHGNDRGSSLGNLTVNLEGEEFVTKVRMAKGELMWGVEGVVFLELTTSKGRVERLGQEPGDGGEVVVVEGSEEFPALKGFYGSSGDVVDRLGAVWGRA